MDWNRLLSTVQCLYKKTDMQREDSHVKMEAETGVVHLLSQEMPRVAGGYQKLGRDKEGGSPTAFRESYVPTNT